ncbi:hypothetical protein GOP47_0022435 [Adiantum capillus-veneris]|uniref:Uncharacterized protein n=1 Tax=Adiantum capillus-veneris TaxID=13818 RepID=A0A9D4U5D5_ADICA|nr:hypothetical protein GOP47_0022435 [Adiantum capillus-veneris]
MAAAETATAAGTRRAVVRSERFVQWQQELSSARRAPYGSRKRNDNGKLIGYQNQQKERENANGLKSSVGIEDEGGEDDAYQSDISQERAKKHRQQRQPQSVDCKRTEKESTSDFHKSCLLISKEAGLCNVEEGQRERQSGLEQEKQEPVPARPIKRRGRRALNKDQELHPFTRGAGGDANAKNGNASSLVSKRSTRLLTRTLRTEEPPPPPLKLPKLHVVLSRKEVQEDWLKMTGRRYTGKPKKSALIHLGLGLCTSMTCPSTIRRYLNDP